MLTLTGILQHRRGGNGPTAIRDPITRSTRVCIIQLSMRQSDRFIALRVLYPKKSTRKMAMVVPSEAMGITEMPVETDVQNPTCRSKGGCCIRSCPFEKVAPLGLLSRLLDFVPRCQTLRDLTACAKGSSACTP